MVKGVNIQISGEIVGFSSNGWERRRPLYGGGCHSSRRGIREDITKLPMFERARLGIGYLSQEPSVFRKLTVEENIMAILETLEISQEERDRRLKRLLNDLDIAYLAKNKAYTLSGGERRRLEITRALVTNPSLILLDEPFSGVDPIAVFEVQKILQRLKAHGKLFRLPIVRTCSMRARSRFREPQGFLPMTPKRERFIWVKGFHWRNLETFLSITIKEVISGYSFHGSKS